MLCKTPRAIPGKVGSGENEETVPVEVVVVAVDVDVEEVEEELDRTEQDDRSNCPMLLLNLQRSLLREGVSCMCIATNFEFNLGLLGWILSLNGATASPVATVRELLTSFQLPSPSLAEHSAGLK